MAVAAMKEGVVDFIEKPFHPPLLLESVNEASRRALVIRDHESKMAELKVRLDTLTSREAEVLGLLAEGSQARSSQKSASASAFGQSNIIAGASWRNCALRRQRALSA